MPQNASLAYGSNLANLHLVTSGLIVAEAIMFQQGSCILVVYPVIGVIKTHITRRPICRRKCPAAADVQRQQTYGQRCP